MMLVVSDAIVLHAFDYLETSRILRLLTIEAGVQSALAKGARRSRGRVGSAVDLFAEGEVELYVKPTRELHTLASFDVRTARTALALDIDRFMAASAIAELALRVGTAEANPVLYAVVTRTFDALAQALPGNVTLHGVAGGWRIVAASGFTPSLDECASCHIPLPPDTRVAFSHPSGGALCDRCARMAPSSRPLPPEARAAVRQWIATIDTPVSAEPALTELEGRAHQRLLRHFLTEHLTDNRPLRAFSAWEGTGGTLSP